MGMSNFRLLGSSPREVIARRPQADVAIPILRSNISQFCHSERSTAESKNLRIISTVKQHFGAKILRRASLVQDDTVLIML